MVPSEPTMPSRAESIQNALPFPRYRIEANAESRPAAHKLAIRVPSGQVCLFSRMESSCLTNAPRGESKAPTHFVLRLNTAHTAKARNTAAHTTPQMPVLNHCFPLSDAVPRTDTNEATSRPITYAAGELNAVMSNEVIPSPAWPRTKCAPE